MTKRHRSLLEDTRQLAKLPRVVAAIEATVNEDGCYGNCDAGRVRGSSLVNHTRECAHMQLLLGDEIPDDYWWDGEQLVYA